MTKRNQHVVPHPKAGPLNPPEGAAPPLYTVPSSQQEAIDRARGVAQNQGTELFIHGRNGRIRERDSHGNDPYPPKE